MPSKTRILLEEIAQFLCVNSEALRSNGLDGKMPLLYFLFAYGKQFQKQHYTDFAFEVLEECLSEEMIKIQSSSNDTFDCNIATLELGWSLQKFIDIGFFKSDEMNEILIPFDTIALRRAEQSINRIPTKDTIEEYLFLATYLDDRVPAFEIDSPERSITKEYLSRITTSVENFLSMYANENLEVLGLFELLNYQKRNRTKKNAFLNKAEILVTFENAIEINDLNTSLFLYLCFPKTVINNAKKEKLFWDKLNEATKALMNVVYEDNGKSPLNQLITLKKYGNIMFKNDSFVHRHFLAHASLKKIKDYQPMTEI